MKGRLLAIATRVSVLSVVLVVSGFAWLSWSNQQWIARIAGEEAVDVNCLEPEEIKTLSDRKIVRFVCNNLSGNNFIADLMVPNRDVEKLAVLFAGYESRKHPETFLEQPLSGSQLSTAILFVYYLSDENSELSSTLGSLFDILKKREQLLMLPVVSRRLKKEAVGFLNQPQIETFAVGCSVGSLFSYAATVGEKDSGIVNCLGIVNIDRLVVQALQYEVKSIYLRKLLGSLTKLLFAPLSPANWIERNSDKPLLVLALSGDYLIPEDEYQRLLNGHPDSEIQLFEGTHRMYLLSAELQRGLYRKGEEWMEEKIKIPRR